MKTAQSIAYDCWRNLVRNNWANVAGEIELAINKYNSTHGGKRDGCGRKKLEPTITMRVPKALKAKIKKLIKEHKKKK